MSISSKQGIIPFLWFDGRCEEAMNFYTSVFPDSQINMLNRWAEGGPFPAGQVMQGSVTLNGLTMHMFDAGPMFKFTEATSFFVSCKDQAEVDHYWNSLTADGGQESMCGWLKDKFGLSWQIVPTILGEKSAAGNPQRTGKMFQAMMQMKKMDVAALEAAYNS
ncbi:VOC family protein [Dyadobacter luticola]|uniref:VOC family protein n=1 Tax=Dyadobacter luticola TaxID=1979387 RepID=A0A5R9L4D8_9BACT|nr:VOC family protein [Dyadobacter luticola]TLV03209.1 VOC family protein [Dyadobacter luticola]